jgi:hypothetical protein
MGGGGGCVPAGPENCFNNVDDDCNGMIDCEDPACAAAATASCVALDPAAGPIGVVQGVGAACPSDFGNLTTIMAGLNSGSCSGCSCDPSAVSCSSSVNDFGTGLVCSLTGSGQFVQVLSSTAGCTVPPWHLNGAGNIFGLVASTFALTPGLCAPSGIPTLSAPTWTARVEMCAPPSVGGGCGAGHACLPILPMSTSVCQLLDGVQPCAAGMSRSLWNTGFSSTQTCGPCACGNATGASCASAQITFGPSGTCSSSVLDAGGSAMCFGSGLTDPGIQIVGSTAGTCQAQSALTGALTATGPKTLCCL